MESHLESSLSTTSSSSSSSCRSNSVVPLQLFPMMVLKQHFLREDGEASVATLTDCLRFINIDWNDVERHFDLLASAGKAPDQSVVKWSSFGYCIGMQQSPEFAKELLMAIRGRGGKWKIDITKSELHSYWQQLTDPCFDSRVKIFFDMCDSDMDGRINEIDIKQAILISASTNKLTLTSEEAQGYAALIMEAIDTQDRGFIEPYQLTTLLKFSMSRGSLAMAHYNKNDMKCQEQSTMSKQVEFLIRSYWKRGWIILFWLTICISLFTWKFIQYKHRIAFEVMGYCLCTAKGAAETLKLNMALILLPVSRNAITWLRRYSTFNSFIPFNDNINFHKLIAGGIVVGVIVHGGTHLACDFPRISGSNRSIFRQTIAGRFAYHQPSYLQILATTEVTTGLAIAIKQLCTMTGSSGI